MNPQLALLLLLGFAVHTATFGARAGIPLVALGAGESAVTVGVLLSLFSVIPLLFSIPAGRLIDRIGARRPVLAGCAAQLLGLLASAASTSPIAFGITTLLVGAGHMTVLIALSNAAGVSGDTRTREKAFNWLALAYAVGVMTGPLCAGIALDFAGRRAPFWIAALPQLTAFVLLCVRPDWLPDVRNAASSARMHLLDVVRVPAMRRILLVSTFSPLCWELFYIFMPIHGSRVGLSASTIGSIMGGFAAAMLVSRLFLPLMQRRTGNWQLLGLSLMGTALALGVLPFADTTLELAALSGFYGFAIGLAYPLQMTLLYEAAPEGRKGEAVGIRQTLLYGLALVTPVALASIGGAFGFAPLMLGVGALVLAGGCATWGTGRARR